MINLKARCLVLLVLIPFGLFADALMVSSAMKSSTIAEVFIEQEAVRVELEIGMGDIPAFKNILPQDYAMGSGTTGRNQGQVDRKGHGVHRL